MRIDGLNPELIRSLFGRVVRGPQLSGDSAQPAQEAREAERADRVEISDEARALAAQEQAAAGTEGLSPERLALIRQRIREGVYDSPEVVAQVARELLRRGDV
ncbi:MAG TPA: flagellar biosynthesis anti-sigma factor FlgM [Longimicrobiales bacterium]|jgi:anti-sigma28 factor (negative regulator of flagellin synthesis)